MKKTDLLYEGKGKKVFTIENEKNILWLEFKDDLTAFNAQKKGSFKNKGAINRDIASIIFRFLKRGGVESHWIQDIGERDMVCEKLTMIPLEVVVRNYVAGSFAKKFFMEEGAKISPPIVEFYYKKDEWADPFISDDQAIYLDAVKSVAELEELKRMGRAVNENLIQLFDKIGIKLVDFKLEFGRNSQGQLKLGDEITPDSCRLWDEKTNEKMDKDRFRRDLGGVAEGYAEVLNRMNSLIKA